MPLTNDMQLVSVDDHLIEPPHLWQDRLAAKYRDAGPKIVEKPSSHGGPPRQVWDYEGRIYAQIGLNAVAGKDPSDWGTDPARFDEMLPGCYDPAERLKDMDLDGVEVGLCFPSFPGFAGSVFQGGKDPELARLCIAAFNDFILDEWCATAPDRFIPLTLIPYWDVAASVAEIERTAAKGTRTIGFLESPVPRGLPSFHTDHWDPIFAAVSDAEIPLSLHFGTSGSTPRPSQDGPLAVTITLFGTNSMSAVVDLLFSPVFHRHPHLKVAVSEGGIGWVPYILERADYVWGRHRFYQNVDQTTPPSELFAEHIYGCFIEDDFGVRNRHAVGLDNILWECDFPHSDSNWPNSRKRATETFADVPDADVRKIVETNARALFRFPRT